MRSVAQAESFLKEAKTSKDVWKLRNKMPRVVDCTAVLTLGPLGNSDVVVHPGFISICLKTRTTLVANPTSSMTMMSRRNLHFGQASLFLAQPQPGTSIECLCISRMFSCGCSIATLMCWLHYMTMRLPLGATSVNCDVMSCFGNSSVLFHSSLKYSCAVHDVLATWTSQVSFMT